MALLTTLEATWLESPLLASAPAVGIMIPKSLWIVDLTLAAFKLPSSGTTGYMFSATIPIFTRFLSFYHAWLPFAIAYLVWRLGYDKRALRLWTVSAWILLTFDRDSENLRPGTTEHIEDPAGDEGREVWVSSDWHKLST